MNELLRVFQVASQGKTAPQIVETTVDSLVIQYRCEIDQRPGLSSPHRQYAYVSGSIVTSIQALFPKITRKEAYYVAEAVIDPLLEMLDIEDNAIKLLFRPRS